MSLIRRDSIIGKILGKEQENPEEKPHSHIFSFEGRYDKIVCQCGEVSFVRVEKNGN
jgi:hypothetical protein